MDNKSLSDSALDIIDQYLHFSVGQASVSIPYYNNKSIKARASLRTYIGKGSPFDIREEFDTIVIKQKIDRRAFTNESLKKFLVDNSLGIECSGFAYHVLEAESQSRGLGTISKKINFINCKGFIGQIRCSIRPIENCNVETFADNKNSRQISLSEVLPGDIITMTTKSESNDRNHILIIREVFYTNSLPTKIHYTHSIAYPEDGIYGTGVRNGIIEISKPNSPIIEANWSEENLNKTTNLLLDRAKRSLTEIRRLNWF